MNALVVIDTLTPAVYSEVGGIDAVLSKLEADVRAVDTDISTPSGRSAIKSLAFKVTRSKTALDEMGKSLVADLKKQTGAVDAERRKIRDRLDALAEEVRKPLTDWENIQKDRISGHEAAIAGMMTVSIETSSNEAPAAIQGSINRLAEINKREWQEFAKQAAVTHATAIADLERKLAAAVKREADAAELARLRIEQAARDQKEREDRIAAEAAAKATRDAEAKAARDAQDAIERAAVEQRRVEQERQSAIARAEEAERARLAAIAKAEQDKVAAAAKSERDRKAAVEAERKRVESKRLIEAAEAARREADGQHKIKVHTEAAMALMNAGLSKDDAKAAVVAIASGSVPHIKLAY
jgi:colicin import membrane protein